MPNTSPVQLPTGTAPTGLRRSTGPVLAIILISYFMILLDNSVIFTALPSIESELNLGAGQLAWVQDAYTLVFGGLLLLRARAGDLFGRRRVFVFGLVVFSFASLLIGSSPSGEWMIAARSLQGIGAAIVAPASLSLIAVSFPEGKERARAIVLYGATAGIGASLGMVIGGAFAEWISWRAGFFINVPIGIAMIALAPRFLPETKPARGAFDVLGALTATGGVGALVFGIIHAAESTWTSPVTVASLAAGVVLLALLVVNEARASDPIMPLRLFASRVRVGGYVGRMLYMGAMIGFFYFTTQYLQDVLGMNPLQAGLGFLPITLVNFAVALLLPQLTRRIGDRLPLILGIALTLAGMIWLSRLTPDAGYLLGVALPMLVIGAGQGLVFAPLTTAGMSGATAEHAGAASGLVNTFHQLGMALGLGVLVAVSVKAGADAATAGAAAVAQVSAALTGSAVLLGIALLICATLILPKSRRGERASTTPSASISTSASASAQGTSS
ncbi:MFS transporter [Pseudoclavibacter helvolus]|uniref:MFS transporter n=1 Tax=Pseudoclavibacter helvolus TaxID=255205 RepID=UPI0009EC008A|nr:MFS transporter [Pseudoclavibacter helvolus]